LINNVVKNISGGKILKKKRNVEFKKKSFFFLMNFTLDQDEKNHNKDPIDAFSEYDNFLERSADPRHQKVVFYKYETVQLCRND
jgi:hypothetical protein